MHHALVAARLVTGGGRVECVDCLFELIAEAMTPHPSVVVVATNTPHPSVVVVATTTYTPHQHTYHHQHTITITICLFMVTWASARPRDVYMQMRASHVGGPHQGFPCSLLPGFLSNREPQPVARVTYMYRSSPFLRLDPYHTITLSYS